MIDDALIALLAVAATAWALKPLRGGPLRMRSGRARLTEEAENRKRVALAAILDLEEERAVGKLADPDFDALRTEYEAQALVALRELDALRLTEEDDEVEAEIARVRAELACPNCGAPRIPGERCGRCGA